MAADVERMRLRAVSTFEHMDEAEITEGFTRMDAALAADAIPAPPPAQLDMLVLARSGK